MQGRMPLAAGSTSKVCEADHIGAVPRRGKGFPGKFFGRILMSQCVQSNQNTAHEIITGWGQTGTEADQIFEFALDEIG